MKRKFVHTGKCIWCGKTAPEVSFNNKPHILPDSVGGNELGQDICDDCNSYFGSQPNRYLPSPDLLFKEIFNLKRFFDGGNSITNGEKFRSTLFPVKDNKLYIKRSYLTNPLIANQLKIAFYEIFLQKYHAFTHNGHDNSFSSVVSYARYNVNISNLKVYYMHQKMWFRPTILNKTFLPFSNIILDELNKTGIFSFTFLGYNFYLEVFKDKADANKTEYFNSLLSKIPFPDVEIEEFERLGQIHEIFNYLALNDIVIDEYN
ncbi:MAG: hypothetical protein J1E97_01140 [Muribaculaceae bacterium]|nr:hypothetical protein [Muribaculaceae bacterium]